MDDLSSKINEIMSDPEKLREIQNLGKMMGLSSDNSTSSQNSRKKEHMGNRNNFQNNNSTSNLLGNVDPSIISKLAPILSNINREDETTRLFDALVPFLSDEKRERLDKIKKMMIVIRLLPNIRNLGLF